MNKEIEQGSEEWLALRKGKLTSSKIPIIMGISPYQTPYQLWEEEIGFGEPKSSSPHMQRGLDVEEEARDFFFQKVGVLVKPAVIFHKQNNLFMASLDGFNQEHETVLEIKNNNREYHEMAKDGKVIDFHLCQMQWQLFCTGYDNCHYLSYRKGDEHIVVVSRDNDYIKKQQAAAIEFKRMIEDLTPPALTDRDYIDMRDDEELERLGELYRYHKTIATNNNVQCELIRESILQRTENRSVKAKGFKLSKYPVAGRISYDEIPELKQVDLEKYRKPSAISYRITLE